MSEHTDQAALFQWAEYNQGQYPELSMMFAIPNGASLPWRKGRNGSRFSAEAMKLKSEGLQPGIPDIFLPVAIGANHGLFIELKFGKNKTTPQQDQWHGALRAQGYRVVVAYGWEFASQLILNYLKGEN